MSTITTPKPKEEIKALYQQIKDKTALQIILSEKFGKEANSIKNNWFGTLFSVPKIHQLEVIEIIKETIENQ